MIRPASSPSRRARLSPFSNDSTAIHSRRVERHGFGKSLEAVLLSPATGRLDRRAPTHRLCQQDLPGGGGRLRPRGHVDDGADGREIAMRPAEFAETEFSAMHADADAEIDAVEAKGFDHRRT